MTRKQTIRYKTKAHSGSEGSKVKLAIGRKLKLKGTETNEADRDDFHELLHLAHSSHADRVLTFKSSIKEERELSNCRVW